ncbi:MAG TPA: NAD(P) transhydrogenase subunit alpha [Gaiellaceae bacterium]|nr:NAD(P) transhydrogenase subunit alpha [Gaiellaceae bacterium]
MPPGALDRATLIVGVPAETRRGERRVALVPTAVTQLTKAGLDVTVERGAGERAGFPDEAYASHGANVVTRREVLHADIVIRVRGWGVSTDDGAAGAAAPGQVVIGLADPLFDPLVAVRAAERNLIAFALELVPRAARAQAVDALSSQATITGYKAVLLAASTLPKMLPLLTTAAGTVPPAQAFVVGAGVAGLQAIATARRLGAVVQAYDVRAAAQEDIESLGARAVLLPLAPGDAEDSTGYAKELGDAFYRRQQELLSEVVTGADIVICTALIPGRAAPVLVTAAAVERMEPGSVIVDCAAERGGNCELTRPDERTVTNNGVTILGPTGLPSTVPHDASVMYSKNVSSFVQLIVKDGRLSIDEGDDIIRSTLVTRDGEIVNGRVLASLREVQRV